MVANSNKAIVARWWDTMYARDWQAMPSFFTPAARYTDVFTPEEDLAVGSDQIVARLRLGIEPLETFRHHPGLVVAEADTVITEHAEEWGWHTGESVTIRFCSVHELVDGLIGRWWDYPDLQKLLGAAPHWWLDHIMAGYAGGPPPDEDYIAG